MLDLIAELIAQYAAPAGAGALASWLFARLRSSLPLPASLDGAPTLAQRGYALIYALLNDPMGAYVAVVALTGIITVVASVAMAALLGQDINVAAATAAGLVASQWRHVLSKHGLLPASKEESESDA